MQKQAALLVAPAAELWPVGQFVQIEDDVCAEYGEYVPARHEVHEAKPAADHVPAGQFA